jgi:hypothetical protein
MFRSSADHHQGACLTLVKTLVFMYCDLGYAAAYVHSFCMFVLCGKACRLQSTCLSTQRNMQNE